MSNIDDPAGGRFHLDKRMNVATIFVMLVQTAGVVWWAAGISNAQEQQAIETKRLELRLDRVEAGRSDDTRALGEVNSRLIRVEEKMAGQNDKLDRILRSVETGIAR